MQEIYAAIGVDREYIQGQINILTSRTLAKKVIESLIASGDKTFTGLDNPEGAFLNGVSVSQQVGTQIIKVGYFANDPIKATRFANALTNVYIQQDIGTKSKATKNATYWLENQLSEVRKKLEASEIALNKYIQKNAIVSVPDIEKKTQTVLEGLKQEKVDAENELAELYKRYKDKHPKIVALNTRLNSINNSINEETKKLLSLNEVLIEYNALKREVETNKSLYESLLKRTKETEVSKELETTNIRIIDLANIPNVPFSPNRKRDILTGIVLGLVSGVSLVFLLEHLDSTVKSVDDIETYIRLPFLGYVPTAQKGEAKTNKDIDVISHAVPRSRIAEAYRSIRTSLIFSAPEDKPLKTILITSSSHQEGKSMVSINLGIVFANANEKTLIVEADMRKPRISESLVVDNKEGLSSFLTGVSSLEAAIKPTNIPNLFLMPSGPRPPNPAELLTSAKTRALLEELKSKFNRVIVDSPPVLTVADTSILASLVDGVIQVIRASFLNIDYILRCKQRLTDVKARIIGVILNNVNVKKEDSYYYYHYYYAEDKEKKA
jgi:capsular exopolysaccharide synthesis family protein